MGPRNTDLKEATGATEAGWRPDPTGRYEWRYWDGAWTNRVASARPSDSADATATPEAPTAAPMFAPAPAPTASPAPARAEVLAAAVAAPTPESSTSSTTAPAPLPARAWHAVTGFFASIANEPESYRSDRTVDIGPDPRGESVLDGNPDNYGRAGIVALAACGVAVGSFLPWISGTIDGIPFSRTGFQENHGWSFTIASLALVCAALLAVRLRPLRWVAMGIALVLAGLTFRDLVQYHDTVVTMNASPTNSVNLGTGMWIMAGCAIVALVASFRLGERE